MKIKNLLLALLGAFTLASCNAEWPWNKTNPTNPDGDHGHTDDDDDDDDDEDYTTKNGHFYGGLVEGDEFSGYEFSKSTEKITKPTKGTTKINIFGINDFHGAIKSDYNHIGLAKLGSVIKQETAKENTLFLDQGDTWQGSFESNSNYGTLIQDVYNYAGATLRTIGNHDFDWGVDQLISTANKRYNETYIPSLGSNIFDFDWDLKREGSTQQKNIGKDYATYILDNGLKVGVVGVIGDDQITSISTQFVKNICFTDHDLRIKLLSNFLRTEKKCDIVIASVHGSASQCDTYGLTKISPISNKKYVDLVLNGHTHYHVDEVTNGVHFVQWDSDGQTMGKVELEYDYSTKEVVSSSTRTFYADSISNTYPTNDPTIDSMVSEYLESTSSLGQQVLSTNFSGSFDDSNELPNLMSKAIFEEAVAEGYDIDYSVVNYARSDFYSSTMTYSDLYTCFPFDNEVIIMEVSGPTCANSIRYNFSYHNSTEMNSIGNYQTYTIACLDYVALHCNSSRQFDKFPGANEVGTLMKNGKGYTYREILKDYLLAHPNETFNSNDYVSSLVWNFQVS